MKEAVSTALNTGSLEMGYAAGVIPAKVKFSGRRLFSNACETITFVVFIAGVAAFFGIGAFFFTEANVKFSSENGATFSEELEQEIADCVAENGGGQRLLNAQTCDSLFCLFEEEPAIPLVTVGGAPVFAGLWLIMLYKFSKTMTWFAVIFNIAIYALIGVALIIEGASDIGAVMLGFSVIWAILTWCYRAKVNMAARHLKTATLGISKNLSVFVATAILEGMLLAVIAAFWFFMVESAKVWKVEFVGIEGFGGVCVIGPDLDKTNNLVKAELFLLLWLTYFFNSAKMITTAMVIGSWFFDQTEDRPMSASLSALKSSLTTSGPTAAVGSLITAIVEFIIRQATSNWWWTDPLGCVLKLLYCVFQSCIIALTRFALISHAFTGDGFFSSSKSVYQVMKKNFSGAYVCSRVGVSVMQTGCSIGSLALGFTAWAWLDGVLNSNTLTDIVGVFDDSLFLTLVFFLGYLYLIKKPLFTLLFITLLLPMLEDFVKDGTVKPTVFAPIGSLFVASIAMIIISFVGDVVMDALDTIFLAYAVGNDNGLAKPTEGARAAVYVMLDDGLIPEAKVVQT